MCQYQRMAEYCSFGKENSNEKTKKENSKSIHSHFDGASRFY